MLLFHHIHCVFSVHLFMTSVEYMLCIFCFEFIVPYFLMCSLYLALKFLPVCPIYRP
jgi:hypothetical protein